MTHYRERLHAGEFRPKKSAADVKREAALDRAAAKLAAEGHKAKRKT